MGKPLPMVLSYGPPDAPWWIRIGIGPKEYEYQGHPEAVQTTVYMFRKASWNALNYAKKNLLLVRKQEDEPCLF
jgi:hypothetical protein